MVTKNTSIDASGFEKTIETNKNSIFRICRIYAIDPLEPEDLFQEVVLQAWKSFSAFRGNSNVGTWLYRVALNVCMSAKLKLDHTQSTSLESISFHVGAESDNDEKYAALRACIGELNASDRSLVVLFLEELSYREIGNVLGLSENHVAVKMKRVRSKLFDCITKKMKL